MKERLVKDPILLIGTLISIILALLIYFNDPNKAETSLTLGLIGVILTLLLDLFGKISAQEEKILAEVRLNKDAAIDPWFAGELVKIIKDWKTVSTELDRNVFYDSAKMKCLEFSGQLREIASGEIDGDQSNYELLIKLINSCNKSLLAVSNVKFDWWRSPLGQTYLRRNIDIIKKHKAKICRIFVLDPGEEADYDLLDEMCRSGIEVYTALVPRENSVFQHFDLAIADEKVMWTTEFTPEKVFKSHIVTCKQDAIQNGMLRFYKLKEISMQYTGRTKSGLSNRK